MCCKNSTRKIIPFLITFAIGIFAASLFYGWTNSNSVNESRLEKGTNHTRTSCGFERMKRHHNFENEVPDNFEDIVPAVPIAPPPPPAPSVATEDFDFDENYDVWTAEPTVKTHRHK